MAHSHTHHHITGERRLLLAVVINVLLTLFQAIGGLLSGSLSLLADALHNLSDAATLGIALFAQRISRRPPDTRRTFGYRRAEIIAALINFTTLILLGLYLIYEALWRMVEPKIIEGWTVVLVASVALFIDLITAALTHAMSKNSMNIRAAFIHNITDALASIAVIIAGSLILLFGWYWTDTLLTILIAAYVLYHGISELPQTIHMLMDGTPQHLNVAEVTNEIRSVDGVINVHHLHLRYLDEHNHALEAHIVCSENTIHRIEEIKRAIKKLLHQKFHISHSTLEFEHSDNTCSEHEHPHHC